MSELKRIPLTAIKENPIALRAVDTQSEKYLGLVDSIKSTQVINPISVKPLEDGAFMLIDGLHRLTASRDAGKEDIPCNVIDMDDAEIKVAQIMANVHKIETKPFQYARQMLELMNLNPTMSVSDMAEKLAKSISWVQDRLGLNKLDENVGALVDSEAIKLSNAYSLSKLPVEEQMTFLEEAQTMKPAEFEQLCADRVKEIRSANRKGQEAGEVEFTPRPHAQKVSVIKDEIDNGDVAKELCKGLKKAEDGFNMALKWVMHLDPQSIEVAKADFDAKQAAKKEKADKLKQEKALKKAEEAEKRANEAREAAEKAKAVVGDLD